MRAKYAIHPFNGIVREPAIKHYEQDGAPIHIKLWCPYGCKTEVPGLDKCPICGHPIRPLTLEEAHDREIMKALAPTPEAYMYKRHFEID